MIESQRFLHVFTLYMALNYFASLAIGSFSLHWITLVLYTIQNEDYVPEFQRIGQLIVQSTMAVYKQAISCLLPTPAKSHYVFNLRDFNHVIVGICLIRKDQVSDKDVMMRCVFLHIFCQ